MTQETLKFIADGMSELKLNYSFMEMVNPSYPYFVGEYSESEVISEDGRSESTFILNGFTRETWLELEQAKALIQNYFPETGITAITESCGIAVSYSNAYPVQTGDAELKRIQINLNVKEWKVN